MRARLFATGRVDLIFYDCIGQVRQLFLSDLPTADGRARDAIMREWDLAVHHLKYNFQLKVSVWKQLPLVVCAIADFDEARACQTMRGALRSWQLTGDSIVQQGGKVFHMCLFSDEILRDELMAWLDGGAMSDSLLDFCALIGLTRTNELSVECMHRSGALLAKFGPSHQAAHLSFNMRASQSFDLFSLQEMPACLVPVNDMWISDHWGFGGHPVLRRWQQAQVRRWGPNCKTHSDWTLALQNSVAVLLLSQ